MDRCFELPAIAVLGVALGCGTIISNIDLARTNRRIEIDSALTMPLVEVRLINPQTNLGAVLLNSCEKHPSLLSHVRRQGSHDSGH